MLVGRILLSLSSALLLVTALPSSTHAQLAPPYLSYAAKFTCGTEAASEGDDVAQGVYFTSINLHNPQATVAITFVKKIVIANREDTDFIRPIILQGTLQPDFADYVDCRFIFAHIPAGVVYVEGFVVIEVPPLSDGVTQPVLDVAAKYTTRAPTGSVNSQNVVQINGQSITF
jgi:hypothetical protein